MICSNMVVDHEPIKQSLSNKALLIIRCQCRQSTRELGSERTEHAETNTPNDNDNLFAKHDNRYILEKIGLK